MPTTRAVLERLSRDELLGIVDAYELPVPSRRGKDQLVEALAASTARLDAALETFPRTRLKALCRACGLNDGGREKAVLVERLTSEEMLGNQVKGSAPPHEAGPGDQPAGGHQAGRRAKKPRAETTTAMHNFSDWA